LHLKTLLLVAIVLFASTISTVAISFNILAPKKVWKYIQLDNLSLDINGTTPCRPIDDDGGP
jgi:hypothetical protein